jgi:hypothetical protein
LFIQMQGGLSSFLQSFVHSNAGWVIFISAIFCSFK